MYVFLSVANVKRGAKIFIWEKGKKIENRFLSQCFLHQVTQRYAQRKIKFAEYFLLYFFFLINIYIFSGGLVSISRRFRKKLVKLRCVVSIWFTHRLASKLKTIDYYWLFLFRDYHFFRRRLFQLHPTKATNQLSEQSIPYIKYGTIHSYTHTHTYIWWRWLWWWWWWWYVGCQRYSTLGMHGMCEWVSEWVCVGFECVESP